MSEHMPHHTPEEERSHEPALDQRAIFDRLARLSDERSWELDESILELRGGDDNDLLGNLVTFALDHEMNPDELFQLLGIDLEQGVEDN